MMTTIKRDVEPGVRKGKEMYKQRERKRDKESDKETVELKTCYRFGLVVTDSGQRGVRHELAELRAGTRWNMCGAIGSAVLRR